MPTSLTVVASYNIDDDTLRLSCPGLDRFPGELLGGAKAEGFRHWRGTKQLVGTWTPEREDFALGYAAEIMDTLIPDDPVARAKRYQRYSAGASRRADERATAASKGLPAGGEPIKLDHYSAKKHLRAIERRDQQMRVATAEYDKAEYWAEKALRVERHARMKSSPVTVRHRIKDLESALRSWQRRLAALHQEGPSDKAGRWAAHLQARIAFEQARLLALEPVPPAKPKFEKGEVVWWHKFGRCELVNCGPKNCRVKILHGGAAGMELRVAREDLTLPQ